MRWRRVTLWISVGLVATSLFASTGCSGRRLERTTVEGVDCVVARAPAGRVAALDCNWPDDDDGNPPQ